MPLGAALPILKENKTSGCGPSGCGTESEESQRLQNLRSELLDIVAKARQEGNIGNGVAPAPETYEVVLSLTRPLEFVVELSHRKVDGVHVWVGVLQGALVVLDDQEHELFIRLQQGVTPGELRDAITQEGLVEADAAWPVVSKLIGRLATAGLIEGIRGHNERKVIDPARFARFHLTQACQLECVHCYADSSPFVDRKGELTTEQWAKAITDFAENGGEQILFTGGEALMHKGCIELLRHSKDLGLEVTLFSNGILIPRYAERLQGIVDTVQISLDGPDAESNDQIRGEGTYKRILKAIHILLKQGTKTRIGMTVVPEKWELWKSQFLSVAEEFAVYPNIEYKLSYGVMQYGRGVEIESQQAEDTFSIDQYLDRINDREGPKITRTKTGCGYAEQLVVGPKGEIFPCHLLDAPMFHIEDYPMPDILDTLRALIHQVDVDHVEGCKTCEIRYLCGGGCRVIESRKTGSRLMNTCNAEKKHKKYKNLVKTFAAN